MVFNKKPAQVQVKPLEKRKERRRLTFNFYFFLLSLLFTVVAFLMDLTISRNALKHNLSVLPLRQQACSHTLQHI